MNDEEAPDTCAALDLGIVIGTLNAAPGIKAGLARGATGIEGDEVHISALDAVAIFTFRYAVREGDDK